MENINNMAENSLESLARDNLSDKNKKKLRREFIDDAVAIACMIVGFAYSKLFPLYTTIPALLYTLGFLVVGVPVFIQAIHGIFTKNLTNAMEILVAIAIISCYFSNQLILSILIPLILNIVHILEERSIMGGREVIEGLKKMQQSSAILLDGENEVPVDAKTLKKGQLIVIRPGSGIPIDGIVVSGNSNVDQKSLTGEPQPASVKQGDPVYAGTVNLDGRIVARVEKEYVDTSFSKILRLLEKSEGMTIPESGMMDRFMCYYIPFVLAVAAAVALIEGNISRAIAILVVSCPCGQMLVGSAPMIAALSAATKRGVLIKNSKFIEELTDIDAVIFDKTGTITEGELSLIKTIPSDGFNEDELMAYASVVASASTHPVSRAVMNALPDNSTYSKDYEVREISGMGMTGSSLDGKHEIKFGSRTWFDSCGISIPDDLGDRDIVGTVSYIAYDGSLVGCLGFGDRARDEAHDSIADLKALGVEKTVMLTGDREAPAEAVCRSVGIDTLYSQLMPQEKLDKLNGIKKDYHVLAVGDGINDALALREADVGIAMGAMGSDLAIQSADIALMNNNLMNIPFVVKLAKETKKIVYQNLVLSIGISVIMIGLSAFGIISALAGSVLHNFGAFAVLINSSRLLK